MEALKSAAFISVGRACGFAGLGIVCLMLGLSFDPALALRSGGFLGLGLASVLAVYGARARVRAYRHTEAWLILPKDDRPPSGVAQRLVGETLRATYFWFAERVFYGALGFLAVSLVLNLVLEKPVY